jgi:hypothetical protein
MVGLNVGAFRDELSAREWLAAQATLFVIPRSEATRDL